MSGVTRTGPADRRLTEIAERERVLPPGVSPHGKTAVETKQAQQPHLLGKVGVTGASVAAEMLAQALEHGSRVTAGVSAVILGPGIELLELLYGFDKAHREGHDLRDAHARDAVNLAFVYAGAAALPPAYVAKLRVDLRAVDGTSGGANRILTRAMASDAEWQRIQKQAADHIRIGRDTASRLDVTSRAALDLRLKNDRGFAALYQQNLGFKHGVDSVLYDTVQRHLYGKAGAP